MTCAERGGDKKTCTRLDVFDVRDGSHKRSVTVGKHLKDGYGVALHGNNLLIADYRAGEI